MPEITIVLSTEQAKEVLHYLIDTNAAFVYGTALREVAEQLDDALKKPDFAHKLDENSGP